MSNFKNIRLFSGNANPTLAQEIASNLEMPLGESTIKRFSDGELWVEIHENVRMVDAYIIQPTSNPANENLMELLIMIDALKRASCGTITAVIPYYGYGRQDRKTQPRVPISAKLVADLLTAAGANRIVALDLHAGQIQGFFNIPFDHLYALPVFLDYFQKNPVEDLVVVSPDVGGAERARAYAKRMGAALALIDKRRPTPNVSEVMHIIGDVKGKNCVLVDDMCDTAGTLTSAAKALIENGAKSVMACCTHAVLSGPALDRIEKSDLTKVIITNTIPLSDRAKKMKKIHTLSVAPLLAEGISRIALGKSVSSLFV
jgi:ribose-phosphate pyrophosphokinase